MASRFRTDCYHRVAANIQSGTFFRISTDDAAGRIKCYVGEGSFTDDPYPMDGGIAVCKVPRLRKLFATLCANGFEHHVAMARGASAASIREATEKYLGWSIYDHRGDDRDAATIL